jgi:hypothetical protein
VRASHRLPKFLKLRKSWAKQGRLHGDAKIEHFLHQSHNKRFSRVGALFQEQFKGKPIENNAHLFNLCIYIHANPVKDGLVAMPEDWEFSNYLEWMNLQQGTLVNREFIEDTFRTSEEYKRLVMEYIQTRLLPNDIRKYLQELEK